MLLSVAIASLSFSAPQDAPALPSLGDLGAAIWTTLADENQDGLSTLEEWESLRAWCASGAADPTTRSFEAQVFMLGIDQDTPRDWTDHDVIATFEVLDANEDGVIERRELRGERLSGEMPALQRAYVNRTARLMLVETADRDGDREVSAEERAAVIAEWTSESAKADVVRRWVDASKAREPENRNAMSPGVTMHTLVAGVDPDANGVLDWPQFEAWFRSRDANGDGALDASEIRIQRPVEGSWRRITDERRALPPLMPWQRNLVDALAIQKRTGQPLLICANIDGETACDSLAYWRYRDPAFAALASGFICLVVSPDDHSPRDHDDRGRRMVSPRLGAVTDAEHIDLEPELYARFFNGRRVAPRHVGVGVDGTVLFDIFLTNDASRVGEMLREHGVRAPVLDFAAMATADLLRYPDAAARVEREARMLGGSVEERLVLLGGSRLGADLAVLGLLDADASVREQAVKVLTRDMARLSREQLRLLVRGAAQMGEDVWRPVLDQADWLGRSAAAERAVADAWIGAVRPSRIGRVSSWTAAARLASAPQSMPDAEAALANLEAVDELLAASPGVDGGALLRATALYQVGEGLLGQGQDPTDAYVDAIEAARGVGMNGAAHAQAIIACASYGLGDFDTAFGAAHRALPELLTSQSDPLVVQTLRALQGSSIRRVYAALSAQEPFQSSDVADALLAGRTLLAHPSGTEADATQLLTLLSSIGDVVATPAVLDAAVGRFPTSADLHGRARAEVLASRGAAGMAAYHETLRRRVSDRSLWPTLMWYEGLAELVAAEWDVQQSNVDGALAHYDASLDAFAQALEEAPGFGDSANHYRVLALAGAAALEAGAGDTAAAATRLVICAGLRPDSLAAKDGLGATPVERAAVLIGVMDEVTAAAVLAAFEAASHPLD